MNSENTSRAEIKLGALIRLYELLDEYGRTLDEPTNRPLNLLIFETFHQWEVKRVLKREEVRWPEGIHFETSETRWVWLQSGGWADFVDEDGKSHELFATYEWDGLCGQRSLQPSLQIVPDYVNSLDEALKLKIQLSSATLNIAELDGDFFPLWRTTLTGRQGEVYIDEAITPSVAILKTMVRQLLNTAPELCLLKLGPPIGFEQNDAGCWENALQGMPGFHLENDANDNQGA